MNFDPPPENKGEVLLPHVPEYWARLESSSTVVFVTVALSNPINTESHRQQELDLLCGTKLDSCKNIVKKEGAARTGKFQCVFGICQVG